MAASNTKFRRRHERAIANMHAGMWGAVNAHADYISDLEPRTRAPAELSRSRCSMERRVPERMVGYGHGRHHSGLIRAARYNRLHGDGNPGCFVRLADYRET